MVMVSLVTGASSGLGNCIAKLLVQKGYRVYVTARRTEKLQQLKNQFDDKIIPIPGDLTDKDFRTKLINTILKKEKKIDYLINNAGFGASISITKQNIQQIENMYNVNILAPIHLTTLTLPSMKKRKKGKIINISSIVSITPLPYFTIYNSTKYALTGFTKSLNYELLKTGVSTTAVLPARMRTEFADIAFKCRKATNYKKCVEKFNKIAESPEKVAKNIVKNLNTQKTILLPTQRAKFLYILKFIPGLIHFFTKHILTLKHKPK